MDIFDESILDTNARILEIGPLDNPQIKRKRFPNVFYGDINNTQRIVELYGKHPNVVIKDIVNIDFVIDSSYETALKNVEKFDYFVASHAVEHVPDIIHFFQDITHVLNPRAKVLIFYPDKRYCFDHFRESSSFSEAYDVYCRGASENARVVLDYGLNTSDNNNATFWWKNIDLVSAVNTRPFKEALMEYKLAFTEGAPLYLNFHSWIFSDESFLIFLNNLVRAKLFPYSLIRFIPTKENEIEFFLEFEYSPETSIDPTPEIANLNQILSNFLETRHQHIIELYDKLNKDYATLLADSQDISEKYKRKIEDYEAIVNSRLWRLLKPLRTVSAILKKTRGL